MIIFGTRGKALDLGRPEMRFCQTCEKERPFRLRLAYQYLHLYYLFGTISKKEYGLTCDVCSRGWTLAAKEVELSFEKHPIPFMHRYGAGLLLGGVALAVVAGVIAAENGI